MTTLQTKPKVPGEATEEESDTWVAFEGMIICGYFSADCYVCARRARDTDFPGCQIATVVSEAGPFPMCKKEFNRLPDEQKRRLLKEWGLESEYPRLFARGKADG